VHTEKTQVKSTRLAQGFPYTILLLVQLFFLFFVVDLILLEACLLLSKIFNKEKIHLHSAKKDYF